MRENPVFLARPPEEKCLPGQDTQDQERQQRGGNFTEK